MNEEVKENDVLDNNQPETEEKIENQVELTKEKVEESAPSMPEEKNTSEPEESKDNNPETINNIPEENTMIPNAESTPVAPKKKGSKIIIPIVIGCCFLFLVFAIIIGILAMNLLSGSKNVVKKEITSVFAAAREGVKKAEKNAISFDLNEETLGIEGNASFKSNYKNEQIDLSKLDKYTVTYGGIISKKDNEASVAFKLKDSSDIINTKMYVKGETAYINLEDIFDKTISYDLGTEIKDLEFSSINYKDIDTLLVKTEKILKDNIDEKAITKTKEEKTINGNKKTYTKVSYKINVDQQTKALLKAYKNDKEAIKILAKLYSIKEEEITKKIDNYLEDLENYPSEEIITENLYLDGLFNKLVGIELISGDTTISAEVNGNVYTYKITSYEEEAGKGVLDLDKSTFTFKINDEYEKINMEMDWSKGDTITASIDANLYDETKIKIESTINTKASGNTMTNTYNIKAEIEMSGEKINFEVNADCTVKKDAKVEKVSTTSAVDLKELTEEDTTTIYTNLMTKLENVINDVAPGALIGEQFRKLI